jgi:hypothetical protein
MPLITGFEIQGTEFLRPGRRFAGFTLVDLGRSPESEVSPGRARPLRSRQFGATRTWI